MLRLFWYSPICGTSLQASKIYKSLGKFVPNQQADSWIFLSIVMNRSFWCFEKIRCWIQFVGRNSGDFVMLLPAAPVQLPFRAPAPFGVERRSLLSRWGNLQLEQKQFFWIFGECNLLREFEWPSWFGDLSIYITHLTPFFASQGFQGQLLSIRKLSRPSEYRPFNDTRPRWHWNKKSFSAVQIFILGKLVKEVLAMARHRPDWVWRKRVRSCGVSGGSYSMQSQNAIRCDQYLSSNECHAASIPESQSQAAVKIAHHFQGKQHRKPKSKIHLKYGWGVIRLNAGWQDCFGSSRNLWWF